MNNTFLSHTNIKVTCVLVRSSYYLVCRLSISLVGVQVDHGLHENQLRDGERACAVAALMETVGSLFVSPIDHGHISRRKDLYLGIWYISWE